MLNLPPSVRVFLCTGATDMRKGIDGLCALVEHRLLLDPLSGHLFCFFNKQRDKIKVLGWDTTGFCLYHKRLESGRFHLGKFTDGQTVTPVMLQLILEGLELAEHRQHKRFTGAKNRCRLQTQTSAQSPATPMRNPCPRHS